GTEWRWAAGTKTAEAARTLRELKFLTLHLRPFRPLCVGQDREDVGLRLFVLAGAATEKRHSLRLQAADLLPLVVRQSELLGDVEALQRPYAVTLEPQLGEPLALLDVEDLVELFVGLLVGLF